MTNPIPSPKLNWQKSTYSEEGSSCVYIAPGNTPATIHLRESDTPEEILTTARPQLAALIAAIKTGVTP
ncbi:hypothetical protein GCM10010277_81440 [Streptomyces longisporoflavus]|uniref:DUF397 domain-containing protein n=1 Tax=Streptomyces longisporoflavus TaxID=28044 RepID=UPI00167D4D9F|nr:DUF397 domain-containing protein [Streptomyces longisporoflavus]GGV70439.1 hypothetical protein GCM10010277_81440 [Streptomyces longisporoflavus]